LSAELEVGAEMGAEFGCCAVPMNRDEVSQQKVIEKARIRFSGITVLRRWLSWETLASGFV
jgi:hypothetical protein